MDILKLLIDLVAASVGAAGFGLLFRVEGKKLLPGALIGGLGYLVYDIVTVLSASPIFGVFAAGLFIGILTDLSAHFFRTPSVVFATMGIIPLVPGYGMFHTMELFVQGDSAGGLAACMETLLIAGALAMSLGFATVFSRLLRQKKA